MLLYGENLTKCLSNINMVLILDNIEFVIIKDIPIFPMQRSPNPSKRIVDGGSSKGNDVNTTKQAQGEVVLSFFFEEQERNKFIQKEQEVNWQGIKCCKVSWSKA